MPRNARFASFFKIGLVLALLGGGAWVAVQYSRPVGRVMAVKSGQAINAVPGSVTVFAEKQIPLSSEIGGRLLRSRLDPGLVVKAGEVLAQLDTGDLDLEIEKLESEANAHKSRVAVGSSIKIELETLREQLANAERLLALGDASASQVILQKRAVRQVEQRLELEAVENKLRTDQYDNMLKVKRRERAKMTVTAPIDGVISSVSAEASTTVNGNTTLATLISLGRNVEAKISEENFSGLAVGQKASVRFLGYGPQLYGASIIKILPTADPQTQRYTVYLNVDLPQEKLVPGLTGEVNIVIAERAAAAIVPRRALRGTQLLVVSDGRVEVRNVKLGYVALNEAEILSGVKQGERVIVDELDRFQPGDRVRTDFIPWPEAAQ